jgi:hypothetical protein
MRLYTGNVRDFTDLEVEFIRNFGVHTRTGMERSGLTGLRSVDGGLEDLTRLESQNSP